MELEVMMKIKDPKLIMAALQGGHITLEEALEQIVDYTVELDNGGKDDRKFVINFTSPKMLEEFHQAVKKKAEKYIGKWEDNDES